MTVVDADILTSILTMSVMTSLSCCLLQNVQRPHVFYEDEEAWS